MPTIIAAPYFPPVALTGRLAPQATPLASVPVGAVVVTQGPQGPVGPGFSGFGYAQYMEASAETSGTIVAGIRTPISMTVDPTQTYSSLRGPFAGFQFWDGLNIFARAYGDAYEIRFTATTNSSVAGGNITLDCTINGATQLTDIDTASLASQAGADQRVSFKLKVFPKAIFVASGARLYVTSTVGVSLRAETLVIEPISAGV